MEKGVYKVSRDIEGIFHISLPWSVGGKVSVNPGRPTLPWDRREWESWWDPWAEGGAHYHRRIYFRNSDKGS